jgi:heptosyltransferase-1
MHELVTTEVSCAASYRKRCPHHGSRHMACLEELSTDRVWQAFVRLMRKQQRPGQAA